jgi:ABC-type nitrate/sulfonate/bicarbonate transport system permease component
MMSTESLLRNPPVVRRSSPDLGRLARFAALGVTVIGAWTLIWLAFQSRGGVVPSPWGVVGRLFSDGWGFYGPNLLATFGEAAQGFLWGNLLALALGAVTALLPMLRPFVSQLALFAYSVPIIAIGPILVTAFPGRTPMVILSAAAVVFLTLSSVIDGLGMSDRATLAIVDSLGGSSRQKLWFVRWWYALPSVFSGIKLSVPGALLGAIFGEYLGRVDSGLGVVLVRAQKELQLERAWGIILTMILVSGIGYLIVAVIGRRLLRWAADVVPAPSSPDSRVWVNVVGVLGSGLLLMGVWWIGLLLARITPTIGKTPVDVMHYLFFSDASGAARDEVAQHLLITLRDMGGGFAAGIILAIACALLATRLNWFSDLIVPLALILRATPLVAIAPIMFIAIGRDYVAVTVLVGIVVFFPAFLILLEGMRITPAPLLDVVSALGGTSGAAVRFVTLPGSVPYLFSALRVTLPNAVMGALIAEWLATGEGLGASLISDIVTFRFDALWAGVFVATTVSVLLYTVVDFAEVAYRRIRRLT